MPANDIESDAAHWLIRLEGDPSPQTRAEFDAWLAADPKHQAAYIRAQRSWSHADIVQRLKPLDGTIDDGVIDKFGERGPVFEAAKPEGRRWAPALAIAASLILVALGATTWILLGRSGWEVYQTEFGGFQRVVLADGTTAMLNTDSRIRARIGAHRREIVLERGEALFTVAHDVLRPFDVTAGDTVVRAVGTAFSVRLRNHEQVDVLVTEGRVAINPPEDTVVSQLPDTVTSPTVSTLSAGETVSVAAGHRKLKVQKVADEDLTRKLAWTQGRIWFDRATLAEAVAEFNRYNRRQIAIDDPTIAGIHIGGAFQATDLDSFVAAIQTFGIRAATARSKDDDPNSEVIRLTRAQPER